jgi:hypothetical protein
MDSLTSNLQLVQRFVRNSSSKLYSGQNAHAFEQGLLVSFQVEQNGAELRVKDDDGSVYVGYVQPAQASALRDSAKAFPATASAGKTANRKLADAPVLPGESQAAAQNYYFRVAGTNRTLKVPVLFTGSISNPTATGSLPIELSGSHISGRVRVGTQREFEVLASPAPNQSNQPR